ncbi:MAG: M14 family zinc carboxypeptidase [Deltaproteobacteria bacterium]|nr:M14 family zinc carboxypeptidase [Deltaproteobacteria bacterium]
MSYGTSSEALASCDDPNQGLRHCDTALSGCPYTIPPSGVWPHPQQPMKADYTSYEEGYSYLSQLEYRDGHWSDVMRIVNLGTTSRYFRDGVIYDPPNPPQQLWIFEDFDFFAVKLTADVANGPYQDRPKILFVCGIHAREWLPQEVCLGYIDRLAQGAGIDPVVDDLLERFEIWVVPFGTPPARDWDEKGHNGDPSEARGRRKAMDWDLDFNCEAQWATVAHRGNCAELGSSEWDGVNIARSFSHGWAFSKGLGTPYDRKQISGDGAAEIPELFDCKNSNLLCEQQFKDTDNNPNNDHHICVDMGTGRTPRYGCFMNVFGSPVIDLAARNACLNAAVTNPVDEQGIAHRTCLSIPRGVLGSFFSWRYVLSECGSAGQAFNDATHPISQRPGPVNQHFQYCTNGVYVDCLSDADCTGLQNNGQMDDAWSSPAQLHCLPYDGIASSTSNTAGYCAYSGRSSCCTDEWKGKSPFEPRESLLLMNLVNDVPFTSVVDLHSYKGLLGYLCKNGGCAMNSQEHDAANGWAVVQEAVDEYNAAAEDEWRFRASRTTSLPRFLSLRPERFGSGVGQFASWTARQVSGNTSFDDKTWRAANAFEIELAPFKGASSGYDASYSRCGGSEGNDFHPASELMVMQATAGFSAMADYLTRQTAVANLGTNADNTAVLPQVANVSDIAMVGAQIHDGKGKGILTSEYYLTPTGGTEAEIVIPAGLWAVSGDALYRCSGAACGYPTPLFISTSAEIRVAPIMGVVPSGDTQEIPLSLGNYIVDSRVKRAYTYLHGHYHRHSWLAA